MNLPWVIGVIIAIIFFAVFETYALRHPDRLNTLSMAIYKLGASWPLSIWICGVFAGGLAVHFFWHFCPAGSISGG